MQNTIAAFVVLATEMTSQYPTPRAGLSAIGIVRQMRSGGSGDHMLTIGCARATVDVERAGGVWLVKESSGQVATQVSGKVPFQGFGSSVSAAVDVNGDGVGDVVVTSVGTNGGYDPQPEQNSIEMLDGHTLEQIWIRRGSYSSGYGAGFAFLQQQGPDREALIAVLDTSGEIEIVFASTGTLLRKISIPGARQPVVMKVLPDMDGDNKSDLVVQSAPVWTQPKNVNGVLRSELERLGLVEVFSIGERTEMAWARPSGVSIRDAECSLETFIECPDVDGDRVSDLLHSNGNVNCTISGRLCVLSGRTGDNLWTLRGRPIDTSGQRAGPNKTFGASVAATSMPDGRVMLFVGNPDYSRALVSPHANASGGSQVVSSPSPSAAQSAEGFMNSGVLSVYEYGKSDPVAVIEGEFTTGGFGASVSVLARRTDDPEVALCVGGIPRVLPSKSSLESCSYLILMGSSKPYLQAGIDGMGSLFVTRP